METALTLSSQIAALQLDIKSTLEDFFANLPEMESLAAMSTALVEQSGQIVVFQRDMTGKITVADYDAYIAATEQVQAIKEVAEGIEELMDPFIKKLYEAHRAATAIRKSYLDPGQNEVKRLKVEREQYAAEEERKRREAAVKAQEEARQREEARLIEEARQAAAQGDSVTAEAILAEAVEVEAPAVVLPSTVPQVQGQSFRSVWEWTLEDATKLKAEFIQPREKEIGALVRSMHRSAEQLVGMGAIRVTERKVVVDR